MTFCTLEIAGRIVLRAEGGPPDAEFALFDPNEIELRAVSPGSNVEAGYRTTAGEALARLDTLGVGGLVVSETARAAEALPPRAYTRGDWGEHVFSLLGPAELFDGYVYDAATTTYEGLWLDHTALARDLAFPRAGAILQALGLRALLCEVAPNAEVVLDTLAIMKDGRPGARSYKRPVLTGVARILDAMRALTASVVPLEPRKPRPIVELVQSLRDRAVPEERFAKFERALAGARPPARGPLADPRAWAIDVAMSKGELQGIPERVDALEAEIGRQPVTIYLRARASLLRGEEAPHVIGERLEQLALSHAFPELELLAAQAWISAQEPRRARAFAHAVQTNPQASAALRRAAESIAEGIPDPSIPPMPPPFMSARPPPPLQDFSMPPIVPDRVTPIGEAPSVPPMSASVDLSPFDWDAVVPEGLPLVSAAAPPDLTFPEPPRVHLPSAPSAGQVGGANVPASSLPPVLGFAGATPQAPAAEPSARPAWAKGASQPPFRTEPPPRPAVPRTLPPPERRAPEPVEMLSLPPGLHGEAPGSGERPRSAIAARIYFTHLARELGREYRTRHGVELWTDVRGIELVQAGLRDDFPNGTVTTPEQIRSLERHGAFLAEVLARSLGAEWTDVAPTEMGYWAMTVPPSTRVWPFGRVHRWVVMGHKERDLVSYYLELEARARPR